MVQPIRGRLIRIGRGRRRNLRRNQSEAILFSAAEGATYGATNRGKTRRAKRRWRRRTRRRRPTKRSMRTQRSTGRNTRWRRSSRRKRSRNKTTTTEGEGGEGERRGGTREEAAGDDDDRHRHRDETHGDHEHTDGAQTGWTLKFLWGYARFMLAVWFGGGAQAASCLVIRPAQRPLTSSARTRHGAALLTARHSAP